VPLQSLTVEDLNLSNKTSVTSSAGAAIESFKFHNLTTISEPAVKFVPAGWDGDDPAELTDVEFIDNPRPNFELRLWNGARDSDGNPEGLSSSASVLSVTGAASVKDLISQLKAHPNYDSTVADIRFANGELQVIWKIAGQPDPDSSLTVTNPVDQSNPIAIAAGDNSVDYDDALAAGGVAGDLTNYPDHYKQEFDLSNLVFHRDTVPKSAGNFFAIQIGSRVLTADNATSAADLAAKLKKDSDYAFVRDQVGLGSSRLELFEVVDIPAGSNVSGRSISQAVATAATGELYTSADGKTYLVNKAAPTADTYAGNVSGRSISQARGDATIGEIYSTDGGTTFKLLDSGNSTTDTAINPAPTTADKNLLAATSARRQSLKINFGENATERGFMYQSTHNVTISDPESAVSALDFVDAAAKIVNESRARMGATMSRIEFTINNLMNVVENTEEAKSRVLDTDYAKESAELAKAQILAQAGTAMLAQANQSQQYVLNLLRQG
jgi:flagellin-like hook-associated protein FlgL